MHFIVSNSILYFYKKPTGCKVIAERKKDYFFVKLYTNNKSILRGGKLHLFYDKVRQAATKPILQS